MSNYVKATNFTAKDSLLTGNPAKIIKGAEIDDEFNAIATAVATKPDSNSPTFTGIPVAPTATAGTNTTQIATTAFTTAAVTAATGALGTMSTQNKTAVDITGGTITGVAITGITDLTVADGGTGLSTLTSKSLLVGNGTSSPTFIAPGTSGNLLASNGTDWASTAPVGALGVGQTWQNFTTVNRVSGTTYTNSTGKPIMVILGYGRDGGWTVVVGGVSMFTAQHDGNNNNGNAVSFIVPNGVTYVCTGSQGEANATRWTELR
jgi:hypothetical protein